ncbi:MAG TPA: aspartate--tRNA ligase [Atribacteraceae bacterium]|nr:aspartate--tRNA ligase [Atribacteraceae bacterium]
MMRSHNCGELLSTDAGKRVVLTGWVNRRRDHGGLVFIDLRDRWGMTQLVFDAAVQKRFPDVTRMRSEYVIRIEGVVRERPVGLANPKFSTGTIEVSVEQVEVLSEATLPPFEIEEKKDTDENLRLRYRYLDLRKARMQKNLMLRHQTAKAIRDYLSQREFIEIETPFLAKSTPEGARDFLVPCRMNRGTFYALPQSPQLFKQILMIAGFDRYYQIVKCFRDEDLRSDRQPEFTQVDIEMSFVDQDDVICLVEGLIRECLAKVSGLLVDIPFLRLTYSEAMARFGTDKPDLRIPLELVDLTPLTRTVRETLWNTLSSEDALYALEVPGWKDFSRKTADELSLRARESGCGLSYIRCKDNEWGSPLKNKLDPETWEALVHRFNGTREPVVLLVWGKISRIRELLGNLRVQIGRDLQIAREGLAFCWVYDFPLFEWNEEENRWDSMHHPFTSPRPEDLERLREDPGTVRTLSYDLVLNGHEIGGGSIRIHQKAVQETVFQLLRLSDDEINQKFGFFVGGLEHGCPPHGGIALGLDRLVMILAQESSIREVIAFPKTQKGSCLLTGAPSGIDQAQLDILGLSLNTPPEPEGPLRASCGSSPE